jgi:hypothetical protein
MNKMSNQDIGAMLRKLAKTPGIIYNPKNGDVLADHTPKKRIVGKFITAEECVGKEGQWPMKEPILAPEPAKPARTLPTRPKKVTEPKHPKRGEETEWQCQEYNHEHETILHDGEGGFYCEACEDRVPCHICDEGLDHDEIYFTRDSGTLQEEFYCEACYNDVRPDGQHY